MRASRSPAPPSPPTKAPTPNSKYLCWDEQTRSCLFLRSWSFVSLLFLREELIVTDSILSFFSPRFHLSSLPMLPLSPNSLALRAAVGLFDTLGLAVLGVCLPLPHFLRGSTSRAFSGYRALCWHQIVRYHADMVFYNSARHLISPIDIECRFVGEY